MTGLQTAVDKANNAVGVSKPSGTQHEQAAEPPSGDAPTAPPRPPQASETAATSRPPAAKPAAPRSREPRQARARRQVRPDARRTSTAARSSSRSSTTRTAPTTTPRCAPSAARTATTAGRRALDPDRAVGDYDALTTRRAGPRRPRRSSSSGPTRRRAHDRRLHRGQGGRPDGRRRRRQGFEPTAATHLTGSWPRPQRLRRRCLPARGVLVPDQRVDARGDHAPRIAPPSAGAPRSRIPASGASRWRPEGAARASAGYATRWTSPRPLHAGAAVCRRHGLRPGGHTSPSTTPRRCAPSRPPCRGVAAARHSGQSPSGAPDGMRERSARQAGRGRRSAECRRGPARARARQRAEPDSDTSTAAGEVTSAEHLRNARATLARHVPAGRSALPTAFEDRPPSARSAVAGGLPACRRPLAATRASGASRRPRRRRLRRLGLRRDAAAASAASSSSDGAPLLDAARVGTPDDRRRARRPEPRQAPRRRAGRRRAAPRARRGAARDGAACAAAPRPHARRDERRRRQRRRRAARARAGREVVAVTLELWRRPGERRRALVLLGRAPCAARARWRTGWASPHFTLDLRDEFRAGVVRAVARRPRRRPDAEPVRALQRPRPPRRDARPRRRGSAPPTLATGHYARVDRRRPAARRRRPGQGPELHARRARRRATLARLRFPLGELTKPQVRALARRGGPAGRRQARLAGPLLPRRHRPRGVPRPPRRPARAARATIVDRAGACSAATAATTASRSASAAASASAARRAAVRAARPTPRANTVTVGPREELATTARRAARRARCTATRARSTRVELRYRVARAVAVPRCERRRACELAEPFAGAAPGPDRRAAARATSSSDAATIARDADPRRDPRDLPRPSSRSATTSACRRRSLVPATFDPSVLLTTAGMHPLKPYFLGPRSRRTTRLTTLPEVLPHARHRERRHHHAAPDVLRDARQLLDRRLLQAGRRRVRLGARRSRASASTPERHLDHGLRGRRGARPRPRRGGDRRPGSRSACRASASSCARARRTSGRPARPARAARARELYLDRGLEFGERGRPARRRERALPGVLEPRLHAVQPGPGRTRSRRCPRRTSTPAWASTAWR